MKCLSDQYAGKCPLAVDSLGAWRSWRQFSSRALQGKVSSQMILTLMLGEMPNDSNLKQEYPFERCWPANSIFLEPSGWNIFLNLEKWFTKERWSWSYVLWILLGEKSSWNVEQSSRQSCSIKWNLRNVSNLSFKVASKIIKFVLFVAKLCHRVVS